MTIFCPLILLFIFFSAFGRRRSSRHRCSLDCCCTVRPVTAIATLVVAEGGKEKARVERHPRSFAV